MNQNSSANWATVKNSRNAYWMKVGSACHRIDGMSTTAVSGASCMILPAMMAMMASTTTQRMIRPIRYRVQADSLRCDSRSDRPQTLCTQNWL